MVSTEASVASSGFLYKDAARSDMQFESFHGAVVVISFFFLSMVVVIGFLPLSMVLRLHHIHRHDALQNHRPDAWGASNSARVDSSKVPIINSTPSTDVLGQREQVGCPDRLLA